MISGVWVAAVNITFLRLRAADSTGPEQRLAAARAALERAGVLPPDSPLQLQYDYPAQVGAGMYDQFTLSGEYQPAAVEAARAALHSMVHSQELGVYAAL